MSVRGRRLISAMTQEAKEKMTRLELEGRDSITGRKLCDRVKCGCTVKQSDTNNNNEEEEHETTNRQ